VVDSVLLNQPWRVTIVDTVPEKNLRIFTLSTLVGAFNVNFEIRTIEYLQSTIVSVIQSESGNNTVYHQYLVEPNTNKWSVNVTGWPFRDPANLLKLKVGFLICEPVIEITQDYSQDELVMRYTLLTSHAQVRASLPYFAVVDYAFLELEDMVKYNVQNQSLEFYFPAFTMSIEYDPDFSIIDEQNNGTGGYAIVPNSGLNTILAPVFGVIAFVGVAVALIILTKRNIELKKKEAKWKEVSF